MSDAGDLRLVAVPAGDLDVVLDLIREASRWVAGLGFDQWGEGTGIEEYAREHAAAGEVFVAYDGDEPVATVTLQWSDPTYWGERPDDAGYVHRLAVRRAHAGRGIGRAVLAWAEERVAERGRPFVRLDCAAADQRIHRYYEDAGYVLRGAVRVGGFDALLYEKRLGGAGSNSVATGG